MGPVRRRCSTDGRYHLFYLHDSWAAAGPSKRPDGYNYKAWAHVSSADLVHWRRHPDAIARGQTGNLFDWNGTPAIVFPHPDGGGASCFASNPEGDLERWRFAPSGAVLRHPVQGNSLYPSSNDVTAWQEGDWCCVLTGTRDRRHGGDAQHLFRSRNPLAPGASHGDTAAWQYVHQFYRSRREWTDANDDCACPEFFRIGSGENAKWMLLHFCHNAPGGSRYYMGSYRDRRFHPDSFDRINWPGGNLHAPRALLDGHGRRILFANVNERRPPDELVAAGWSGCLSLPVVLTLARRRPASVCFRAGRRTAGAPARAARVGRRGARCAGSGSCRAHRPCREHRRDRQAAPRSPRSRRARGDCRRRRCGQVRAGRRAFRDNRCRDALGRRCKPRRRQRRGGGAAPGGKRLGRGGGAAPGGKRLSRGGGAAPGGKRLSRGGGGAPGGGWRRAGDRVADRGRQRRRLRRQGALLPGRRRGNRHRAQHRRARGRDRVRQGEPARRPRVRPLGREAGIGRCRARRSSSTPRSR